MAAMYGHSLFRKICGRKLGTLGGLRKLCTDGAKFCMIIYCDLQGGKGVIAYDIAEFEEWDNFVKHTPILKFIPTSGLYGKLYDPNRPYCTVDAIRRALRTASLTVFNANKCGLSLVNPFYKGNVGVLKTSGCIAFKCFQLDLSDTWKLNKSAGYNQACTFFKDSISDTIGDSALNQLPHQLDAYFNDLEKPTVNEDLIIEHPSTLPNMVYSDVCSEACRFLIKGWSGVKRSDRVRILKAIGTAKPDVLSDCLKHEILHQFLPKYLQDIYPYQDYPFANISIIALGVEQAGMAIVEVCRHSGIHAEDRHVRSLVFSRLNITAYSRDDMTDLVRAAFPNFLRDGYNEMVLTGHWDKLKIKERLPIPTLYSAPPTVFVAHHFVIVFLEK